MSASTASESRGWAIAEHTVYLAGLFTAWLVVIMCAVVIADVLDMLDMLFPTAVVVMVTVVPFLKIGDKRGKARS